MSPPVVVGGYLMLLLVVPGILLGMLLILGTTTTAVLPFSARSLWTGEPDPNLPPDPTLWIVLGGFLSAFLFGLPGWLLVMKKRVLQCSACGAVTPAS